MASSTGPQPIFRAVTSSTRPLFQLLRCINFTNKVHVQITPIGLRFSADNSRVVQGIALLDKSLFTSYTLNWDQPTQDEDEESDVPVFQVSLPYLLESLQILGSVDLANRAAKSEQEGWRGPIRNYQADVFSNQALGISGTCSLVYMEEGGPFTITIEESGVRTTANLVTYTPEIPDDIPFDRADLAFKIIMHPRSLLDALNEVATMGPRKLVIRATNYEPWLLLAGKGGDFGASSYDFSKGRELLESVSIREDWVQSYKFDLIKSASEAMRLAHKLSFRGDRQGVLSLQFIVEVEGVGSNFLEFTFVPFAGYEEEGDDVGDES